MAASAGSESMEPSRRLDLASRAEARALLFRCCGSTRWVDLMLERRPFATMDALLDGARLIWQSLGPDDWKEAFRHHPRIGDRRATDERFASIRTLSQHEQAGLADATTDEVEALVEGNRAYESRFGFVFLVCATGKPAAELLARLRERLANDPATELRIAAGEQAKITAIRLEGLRAGEP
jgi:2-oxo-4-hydroxy-4-carboxy-5-ureidoimidazoline decarboxylase